MEKVDQEVLEVLEAQGVPAAQAVLEVQAQAVRAREVRVQVRVRGRQGAVVLQVPRLAKAHPPPRPVVLRNKAQAYSLHTAVDDIMAAEPPLLIVLESPRRWE